jgi:hypothetical protein
MAPRPEFAHKWSQRREKRNVQSRSISGFRYVKSITFRRRWRITTWALGALGAGSLALGAGSYFRSYWSKTFAVKRLLVPGRTFVVIGLHADS